LLAGNHVMMAGTTRPENVTWTGGHAVLVVTGDMIDKGPSSLEVLDLIRALEQSASMAGGRVIALVGNHEAEFFADPENSKACAADGVNTQLRSLGVDPYAIASGRDPRGAWLRNQAFGARVGRWFFSHTGSTSGRSVAQLEDALRNSVTSSDYRGQELLGSTSILEARDWWNVTSLPYAARALDVDHFVFGHTPSALGPQGSIAVSPDHMLLRIDCGMSPDVNDSTGALLRIRVENGHDVAEELRANGFARRLL
jgi:hypothetical protein